ncbi:MAG: tetratricopeptide repeat protein, partial [Kiloniellaceae bacterium]
MNWRLPVMIIAVLCIGIRPLYAQSGDARAYLERGRVLAKAGKSTQALPYFLLALETAENRHGKDSPEILTMLESLAGQYAADRLFRDAEPLYRQSLGIQERAVTGQMAGLARTLNSLGAIYEATERMDQAREVYARVLRQVSPTLGADHPAVVAAHDRLVRMSKVAAPAPAAPPAPVAKAQAPPPAPPAPVVKAKAPPAPPPAPVPAAPPATVVKAKAPPAPPPPSPKAKPGYRIHLTSIRHRGDAGREWARLKRLYGALLADLELAVVRVDLGAPRGVYFRVQGGPLTRAGARGRCARFSARGVWC